MSTETLSAPITMEQFLELERHAPEGVRLAVINGELREYPDVTMPAKAIAIGRIGMLLSNWLEDSPNPRGEIAGGAGRCRLSADPVTIMGLDVAWYADEEQVREAYSTGYFDGPPVLAIEVLSPTDTHRAVVERIDIFLSAGVKQVWVVDPDLQTVTIHRPDAPPVLRSRDQELDGGNELPGFRCNVRSLFGRER